MKKNILLLGAPGSGKGTQAKLLEEKYDLEKIDTGSLIRSAIANNTELGQKAKDYVAAGKLIPDDLVIDLVLSKVEDITAKGKNVLFDGFPRNIAQAEALQSKNIQLGHVLDIEIPFDLLVDRIVGRRMCTNKQCGAVYHLKYNPSKESGKCDLCGSDLYQRDDDKEELVQSRLNTYNEETLPLSEFYERQGLLLKINGNQEMNDVFAEISNKIGN